VNVNIVEVRGSKITDSELSEPIIPSLEEKKNTNLSRINQGSIRNCHKELT